MIGSMSGVCVNIPQAQAPYNASKAAVRHMASSLAVEWATKNIRVNVISPGEPLRAFCVPYLALTCAISPRIHGHRPDSRHSRP